MSYSNEGYVSHHRDNERVAAMLRSIVQDGAKDFKECVLDLVFPKKLINGIDIGEKCSNLAMKIAGSVLIDQETSTPSDKKIVSKLLMWLMICYRKGINPENNIVWKILVLEEAVPGFMRKINSFPGTGKAAPMASLIKPEKARRDVKTVRW